MHPDLVCKIVGHERRAAGVEPSGLLATHADWDHLLGRLAFPGLALGVGEPTGIRLRAEPGTAQRHLREADAEHYVDPTRAARARLVADAAGARLRRDRLERDGAAHRRRPHARRHGLLRALGGSARRRRLHQRLRDPDAVEGRLARRLPARRSPASLRSSRRRASSCRVTGRLIRATPRYGSLTRTWPTSMRSSAATESRRCPRAATRRARERSTRTTSAALVGQAIPIRYGSVMERKWWTLIVVCVATFMLLLDITVVNVALPDIQSDLDASFSRPPVGGRRIRAHACRPAPDGRVARRPARPPQGVRHRARAVRARLAALRPRRTRRRCSNVARGLQGIGGAVMFATSLALLAQEFQGTERGTAFGVWGATIGFAVAVGPLVGGAITEGIGWEWIFFINVPIGIGRAGADARARQRVARPEREAASTGPAWSPSRARCSSRLRAHHGQRGGLGQRAHRRPASRSRSPCCSTFLLVEHRGRSTRCSTSRCSASRPSPARRSSPSRCRRRCSRCSSTSRSTSRTCCGFSPLETGWRFLPLSLLSFFVAPISGKLSERVPVRGFMGGGLLLVGSGLLLMHGVDGRLGVDHAAGRLHHRRRGHRHDQPGARLDGDRRGAAAAQRHGVGHQHHVPPGGHRHRHRRARRDLPAPRGEQGGRGAGGHARRPGRPPRSATPWPAAARSR